MKTVQELIEELQQYNPDTYVVGRRDVEWRGHSGPGCHYSGCDGVIYSPAKIRSTTVWDNHLSSEKSQTAAEGIQVLILEDSYYESKNRDIKLPKHSHHYEHE